MIPALPCGTFPDGDTPAGAFYGAVFCTVHHDFVLVITQILGGAGVPIMFKTVPERSTHYYVMVKSSDIDRANKALEGRGKFI